MKKVNMILDSSEFATKEQRELEQFINEREETAIWLSDEDCCRANEARFLPIYPEPICVSAEVAKLQQGNVVTLCDGNLRQANFSSSEEAYADSMYAPEAGYDGSTQMMSVNGKLYPVGKSAIAGIAKRAGITADGWDKLRKNNPKALSEVLDRFFKETGGNLTVLIEDEKVRAVNSGSYAACPASTVLKAVNEWIATDYPNIKFIQAYANHEIISWHLDLSAYAQEILGAYPELINNGFMPAMTVSLSHTGNSSVSYTPALMNSNVILPIGKDICAMHIGRGTFSERMLNMETAVKKNLKAVFPKLTEVAAGVDKLRSIQVNNAYNALLRGMCSLGIPKVQGLEAAEQFKDVFGDMPTTAFDLYVSIVDAMVYVARDFPNDYYKQLNAAKCLDRAVTVIDWAALGNLPGDFSW